MFVEQLVREPDRGSLRRPKISALRVRELVERAPVGSRRVSHEQSKLQVDFDAKKFK
jgi:hypothetical protein